MSLHTQWHERSVTYVTESPARRYAKHIADADTIASLRARLRYWSRLAPDAVKQAATITQRDWTFARENRRNGKHAERVTQVAGAILLPRVLLGVEMVARNFGAPWGTAFIRCKEEGLIYERSDGLHWNQQGKASSARRGAP